MRSRSLFHRASHQTVGPANVLRLLVLLALLLADQPAAPARAESSTITVTTTVETVAVDGNCSIREAVQAANTNLAVNECIAGSALDTDTIAFSIGSGPMTITLTSALAVSSPVLIDGTTQTGFIAGNPGEPLIRITGSPPNLVDFQSGSAGSTIKGLRLVNTLTGALGRAVRLADDNIRVSGNYIHTDGLASLGGDDTVGVLIADSDGSTIGGASDADRNLFGGVTGIRIDDGTGSTIQNNWFGTNKTGSVALTSLPGSGFGILAGFSSSGSFAGHLIRGNIVTGFYEGIGLYHFTHNNSIVGNYIGVGADGVSALPNSRGLVIAGSDNNTIGGLTAADRNVISGNTTRNIRIENEGTEHPDNNVIQGNYLGPNAFGTGAVSATGYGIFLVDGDSNIIGGTAPGSGNVISGNNTGVDVCCIATGTVIRGNRIGTNANGTLAVANTVSGIYTQDVSVDIGSSTTPGGNLISGNGGGGIQLNGTTTGTTIFGNKIGVGATSGSLPNGNGVVLTTGASATISKNWIAFGGSDGIFIDPTSTVNSGSTLNCFTGNATYGVDSNNSSASAPLGSNWWGHASGPSGSGPGSGDAVTSYVTYSPWLTVAPGACRYTPTADFDSDGDTDLSVFRPSTGVWYLKNVVNTTWGTTADVPVPGDYDGDGDSDVAIWRPSTGIWYIKDVFNSAWGTAGDVPVPGDYDGDGDTDVAVWRPSDGKWYVKNQSTTVWGSSGDIPVQRDYDGDGDTDLAVFRPSTGVWYIKGVVNTTWGSSTDIPVPGDYNADGTADVAIFRPSSGIWYIKGLFNSAWGNSTDIPVPGDYDADGDSDVAIWRPSTGTWYVKFQFTTPWGSLGDFPLPARDTNGDGDPYQ